MPPVGKSWDERQMTALTDYLTTLLWHGLSGIQAAADLPDGRLELR